MNSNNQDPDDEQKIDYGDEEPTFNTGETVSEDIQKQQENYFQLVQSNQHLSLHIQAKFNMRPQPLIDEKTTSQKYKFQPLQGPHGHYLFSKLDWNRSEEGHMYMCNKEQIEAQKRVLKHLLKSITSSIFSKEKSVMATSMPVDIFDTRSNLQRMANTLTMAPLYLEKAVQLNTDPIEQFRLCVAFAFSLTLLYLNLEKPFNPILGQTYQGFIQGCPIYLEQISHHPPICSMQYFGRGYRVELCLETKADINLNSISGQNVGQIKIIFEDTKQQVLIITPSGTVNNINMGGDRYFNFEGKMFVLNLQNDLAAEITFYPEKQPQFKQKVQDFFEGQIFQLTPKGRNKFEKQEQKYQFKGWNGQDDQEPTIFGDIAGFWSQFMNIDQMTYWSANDPLPYQLEHEPFPLASDSNYRQDIIFRQILDKQQSQFWKETLENIQRKDKQLRETYAEEMKKLSKQKK